MPTVQLFGVPALIIDNQPVFISRRVTRSLLFYLAGAGRPVPREQLMELLWPDQPEAFSRQALRDQLSKVRTCLGDKQVLQTDLHWAGLDMGLLTVDWLDF